MYHFINVQSIYQFVNVAICKWLNTSHFLTNQCPIKNEIKGHRVLLVPLGTISSVTKSLEVLIEYLEAL